MKKTKKIKIILNGKSRSLQKTTSVYNLMRSLKLSTDKVAIELNKEIINKKTIKNLYLKIGITLALAAAQWEVSRVKLLKKEV